MTTRPTASVVDDCVEPLLEEFLAEVVTGFRPEYKANEGEGIATALKEAVMVSFSRALTQASPVERALLAEALSPALADALAPALAKELAPEIVTALSHLAAAARPSPAGSGEGSAEAPATVYRESAATAYDDAGPEGR